MRMTVLASGSKGNSTVVSTARTRVLVDAGLSCRELLRRMNLAGEDPAALDAILITHEHIDHVAGLAVLARRLNIPVFFTESTHRAWVRMVTPRTTMSYAKWLDHLQQEKEARAASLENCHPSPEGGGPASSFTTESGAPFMTACSSWVGSATEPEGIALEAMAEEIPEAPARSKPNPAHLPAVEFFHSGSAFTIGDLDITPFTIPHDATDPCGFVFHSRTECLRMAVATDLGYMPPPTSKPLSKT